MTEPLVLPEDVKRVVQTALSDEDLQALIDQEDAEVVQRFGPHFDDTLDWSVTEVLAGESKRNLYFRRALVSVSSITEDEIALTAATYRLWGAQGRIERLPQGSVWGNIVTVEYVPADDNERRKAVIVDLVRIALQRTAMQSESIAGEYSYTAPEWESARANALKRLAFVM